MKLSTKKRWAKFAAATAVSAALIVAPSVAAMADAQATYSSGGQPRATGYWNASTDTISSTDRYNDGWGSRTWWNLRGNTSSNNIDNTKGAGQTESRPVWVLPGWEFRVQACSINNGTSLGCSSWSGYSGV
ncbi:hypothetical protein [Microbacterium sp. Root553]|uniref:hypothetical protein n=1 Tax=Microbacterium sp. Root553 TaxID=1736556 RepID=UPI0006FEADF9|nr:hypothetical protein [Microbacterium sp. Root553]